MGKAEAVEPDGLDLEAAIHVGNVAGLPGRPEAFGERSGAGPDAGVDRLSGDLFGPHADFAAEDEFLLVESEGGVVGDGVVEVMRSEVFMWSR